MKFLADISRQLEKDFKDRLKREKDLLKKEQQNKLDKKERDKEKDLEAKKSC